MASVSIVYTNEASSRGALRVELEGQSVGYEEADEVLGEEFVRVYADKDSFIVPKARLVYVYIKE